MTKNSAVKAPAQRRNTSGSMFERAGVSNQTTEGKSTVLADLRASYGQLCDPGCHGRCRVCPADAVTAAIAFIEAQQSPEQATERSARRDVETGMEMAGSKNGQSPEPSLVQQLADARDDVTRLHRELMDLKYPGSSGEPAETDAEWKARQARVLWAMQQDGEAVQVLSDECARQQRRIVELHAGLSGEPGGQPTSDQAPIARVTVTEGDFATVTLYAPGLPPGAHDLYCVPHPGDEWPTHDEAQRQVGVMALKAAGQHAERVVALEAALTHAAKHIRELHDSISRRVYESEERDRSDAFEGIGDGQYNGDWRSIEDILEEALPSSSETKEG